MKHKPENDDDKRRVARVGDILDAYRTGKIEALQSIRRELIDEAERIWPAGDKLPSQVDAEEAVPIGEYMGVLRAVAIIRARLKGLTGGMR